MLNSGHYLGRQNAHDVIDGSMKAFEEDRMLFGCFVGGLPCHQ